MNVAILLFLWGLLSNGCLVYPSVERRTYEYSISTDPALVGAGAFLNAVECTIKEATLLHTALQ
jgi:hypothetical protein